VLLHVVGITLKAIMKILYQEHAKHAIQVAIHANTNQHLGIVLHVIICSQIQLEFKHIYYLIKNVSQNAVDMMIGLTMKMLILANAHFVIVHVILAMVEMVKINVHLAII